MTHWRAPQPSNDTIAMGFAVAFYFGVSASLAVGVTIYSLFF